MSIEKKIFNVPSCDGRHTLSGVVFLPEGEIKGFYQVVHGMTEHVDRYERFMTDLAEAGYLCFGHNHLGHKGTVADEELGYIAKKGGHELMARDVKTFADAVFTEFGRAKEPYCLMGHSMGSFVVRLAAERYVNPDRLIVMGTGGPNPAAGAGLAVISLIKLFRGDRHVSKLVDGLAFGSYNKRFPEASETDPGPWLTTDKSVRERYYADKYCTFKFTVSAMGDLIRAMKLSNRSAWYKNLPKELPILLISGAEDPVGGYGKGVRTVEKKLRAAGVPVECILYDGARHEILNDFTYSDTLRDILNFIK